ncbi:hypothetical protein KIN20_036374 [Parelaphostrongylus tenuis]|uniref:Uncharacterized protein n=1 Tax=Parelaphostrongylus tenuis TaxID=148309 RepID=A0AAD5RD33_PARTN|nr:hypothetical protein KIN20_036374 [Parelaphostrongylus tenuis]
MIVCEKRRCSNGEIVKDRMSVEQVTKHRTYVKRKTSNRLSRIVDGRERSLHSLPFSFCTQEKQSRFRLVDLSTSDKDTTIISNSMRIAHRVRVVTSSLDSIMPKESKSRALK